ncbi:MAG: hypothetical protein NVSMB62_12930 [Acidobacteriaceae bacterium]
MEVAARNNTRSYLALAALAVLLGPVRFSLGQQVVVATQGQITIAPALVGIFAGVVLVGLGLAGHQPTFRGPQRLAIVALLLPPFADHLLHNPSLSTITWLRLPPGGDALLLTLAAPLWLGLLVALQAARAEVPRITIAAAIAAIGAACLTVPLDAYTVAATQIVMLIVQLALLIATVWSWYFARERLNPTNFALTAGVFLLLQTAILQAPTLLTQKSELQPIDWRHAVIPVLLQALATAAAMLLWFWLLTRMTPAAFTLHPLALWIASTATAIALFGLTNWREDTALAVALAALIAGLRAHPSEEHPITLELT